MDPETVELGATLGALESPAGRLHHPARHVLPPRGHPPRRRGRRQPARHRPGVLRRPRPRRPGVAERLADLRAWPARARRDRRPGGPRRRDAARHLHLLARGPDRGRRDAAQGAHRAPAAPACSPPTSRRPPPRTPASASATTPPPPSCSRAPGGSSPTCPLVLGPRRAPHRDRPRAGRGGRRRDRPLPRVEPQAGQRRPALGGGARRRHPARRRHRRLLQLQRPRHVAGDAPGGAGRPAHQRPPRRRERHRGAAGGDHRRAPAPSASATAIGSVEVGKRADLVLARPRGTAPHARCTTSRRCWSSRPAAATSPTCSSTARLVVRDRRSTLLDTDDLLSRARAQRRRRPGRGGGRCEHRESAEQVIARLKMSAHPRGGRLVRRRARAPRA